MTGTNSPLRSMPRNDRDRAVSSNVNYVLSLAVMTMLLAGLTISAGNVIEEERSRVIRAQLEVLGERLASDMTNMDYLARSTGSDTTLRSTTEMPDQVVSRSYTITVQSGWRGPNYYTLVLSASDVNVRVPIYSLTDIATEETPGGTVEVVYTGGQLEVRDV